MKSGVDMRRILFMIAFAVLAGCSSQDIEDLKKSLSPVYPNTPATHLVDFYKIQVGATDFGQSTFGGTNDIRVSIHENGEEIFGTTIKGTRGERHMRGKHLWPVQFTPESNYQIIVEEKTIIAGGVIWSLPGTPKLGYWPIALNDGKVEFGENSILWFKDTVLPVKESAEIHEETTDLKIFMPIMKDAIHAYRQRVHEHPSDVDELVEHGYLEGSKGIWKNWRFDLVGSDVDVHSLFVDGAGKCTRFKYDYETGVLSKPKSGVVIYR